MEHVLPARLPVGLKHREPARSAPIIKEPSHGRGSRGHRCEILRVHAEQILRVILRDDEGVSVGGGRNVEEGENADVLVDRSGRDIVVDDPAEHAPIGLQRRGGVRRCTS